MHAQLLRSIKARFPDCTRKSVVRSGDESPLRTPGKFEKAWRAKVTTRRLTKLIHNGCIILFGVRYHPGKGTSTSWSPFRIYWRPIATGVSRSNQDTFTSVDIMQRAKVTYFGGCGNMRYPTARKSHGYGASIIGFTRREAGLRLYTQNSAISDSSMTSCGIISKHRKFNKDKNFVNKRLINIIGDVQTLIVAYEFVKSKPGQMVKGSIDSTLDDIDLAWIKSISKVIKAGKFKFIPSRRIYVSKTGCKERRPIMTGFPRDKLVQKAIQLVLEPIYENVFLENSHGFRPARGCHTALKSIKQGFHGVTWVIESDIASCFSSVNHEVLLSIIKERIKCVKTLALIRNLLESGYVDLGAFCKSKLGIPQGSSLSPLLCNIYLHKFDTFMYELKQRFVYTSSKDPRINPAYKRLQRQIQNTPGLVEKSKFIQELRKTPSKDLFDPKYRRLFYIRYADDFSIGITGQKKDAVEILDQAKIFLSEELKMDLKESKIRVVHLKKQSIFFLGTTIYGISCVEKPMRTVKHSNWKTSIKIRVTPRVGLHAPMKVLLEKLLQNKFVKRDKEGIFKPTALGKLVNFDHADIIGYYNSVARGIMNYYSFVDNYSRLGSIVKYYLLHSCALTLALKYKLRFKSKAFKRFGGKLKCPDTKKEFFIPKNFFRTEKFSINPPDTEQVISKRWNNKLTKSSLFKACVICGTTPAEMYHVCKTRDLRNKYKTKKLDFFKFQMASFNQKQVPLCQFHHKSLHQGKLSEADKVAFREGITNL
uniref:Orf762 n=1 Tax=Rhodomonas salina TaxID=3034 RepID=Q9G8T2_RHDSA|nr:orf762 [Rhodomonas salina]AAG17765.1 orf762 [Rhodomonas salina]